MVLTLPAPPQSLAAPAAKPKLLDQLRQAIRALHYSIKTEEAYVHWARRYILFHGKRHPAEMGEAEVNQFLTDLAVSRRVAASTQNQALAALLFLYEKVLRRPLDRLEGVVRAKRPKRLPVVLCRDEVQRILAQLNGVYRLIALLQYGAGLRLQECLQLRVKDLDGGNNVIMVRHGKGGKDRRTMFPEAVKPALREHVRRILDQHRRDLSRGLGRVPMPEAFDRKAPRRQSRILLAIRLPRVHDLRRSAHRPASTLAPARECCRPCIQAGRRALRHRQTSDHPRPAALLRDAPARSRL